MKIIDLSHSISPNMPVYPGTEQPVFHAGCTIESDGFLEKKMTFFSHTGTHIDAPAHLIKEGRTLDQLSAEHFVGEAFLLGIEQPRIDIDFLRRYEEEILKVDFLLFKTDWCHYWGTEKYFSSFPVLTVEAARWLSACGLKGVGIDAISFDGVNTHDYVVHKTLLEKDVILIENLTNLAAIENETFKFICLPLKIADADGSPVRAIAEVS